MIFIMSLDGEWEFYWSRMLRSKDFSGSIPIKPDLYGKVPSYWTDYTSETVNPTGKGFATYRLLVCFLPDTGIHWVLIFRYSILPMRFMSMGK